MWSEQGMDYRGVSQTWHPWPLGLDESMLLEALLCIVGWLMVSLASLASARSTPTPTCDNQKCLQTLADVPWGQNTMDGEPLTRENQRAQCKMHQPHSSPAGGCKVGRLARYGQTRTTFNTRQNSRYFKISKQSFKMLVYKCLSYIISRVWLGWGGDSGGFSVTSELDHLQHRSTHFHRSACLGQVIFECWPEGMRVFRASEVCKVVWNHREKEYPREGMR